MSLYSISSKNKLPHTNPPNGLSIELSTDISLLSAMGNIAAEEVVNRFANDHVAFIAFINKQPAAFGWLARSTAKIGELNHHLVLPNANRYLWNFRTMDAFRGMGIYPALLQFIIRYESNKAERFWIIHAPENTASLNGIKKAGFEFVGTLYTDLDGKTVLEDHDNANSHNELVTTMGIVISGQEPASCWNCSSPYLKKRTSGCCCASRGNQCTGKKEQLLIS